MHNCPNCGIMLRKYEDFDYGNVTVSKTSDILLNGQQVKAIGVVRIIAENLIRSEGRVLSRSMLLEVSGCEDGDLRTADVYVRRVRTAMREIDPSFDQIKTVHGLGYRWEKKKAAAPQEQQPELMMAA